MICPYCNHSFPLTWARYFRSPLGKHDCPECGAVSRLNWPPSYFAFAILVWVAYVTASLFLTQSFTPTERRHPLGAPYFLAIYLIGCVIIVPLDRWYDERFRKLEKPGEKDNARMSAGIGALPDGAAQYARLARFYTTTAWENRPCITRETQFTSIRARRA